MNSEGVGRWPGRGAEVSSSGPCAAVRGGDWPGAARGFPGRGRTWRPYAAEVRRRPSAEVDSAAAARGAGGGGRQGFFGRGRTRQRSGVRRITFGSPLISETMQCLFDDFYQSLVVYRQCGKVGSVAVPSSGRSHAQSASLPLQRAKINGNLRMCCPKPSSAECQGGYA